MSIIISEYKKFQVKLTLFNLKINYHLQSIKKVDIRKRKKLFPIICTSPALLYFQELENSRILNRRSNSNFLIVTLTADAGVNFLNEALLLD